MLGFLAGAPEWRIGVMTGAQRPAAIWLSAIGQREDGTRLGTGKCFYAFDLMTVFIFVICSHHRNLFHEKSLHN
jgi:hypothetical protein